MAELILREKPKTVVEIGVFGGQSFFPQALTLKWLKNTGSSIGIIYGIDPYDFDVIITDLSEMDDKPMWLKQDMEVVRADTLRWIKDLQLADVTCMIRSKSSECSLVWPVIDILHIDGSHSVTGALMDVNDHARNVRSGGFIWMDDTHFPSLQPALKELATFADMVDDWGGYQLWQRK